MVVIVGIAALIGFAMQLISFDKAGARLTRVIRNETFQSLLRQEIGFYDEDGHSLGALTSRLATDAADVTSMVSKAWGEVTQFVAYVNYYSFHAFIQFLTLLTFFIVLSLWVLVSLSVRQLILLEYVSFSFIIFVSGLTIL